MAKAYNLIRRRKIRRCKFAPLQFASCYLVKKGRCCNLLLWRYKERFEHSGKIMLTFKKVKTGWESYILVLCMGTNADHQHSNKTVPCRVFVAGEVNMDFVAFALHDILNLEM